MKTIFLDFDGPIIPYMSHVNPRVSGKGASAWPSCIEALNRITDATGAKIVVSSTWRLDGLSANKKRLKDWGATGSVVGITPRMEEKKPSGLWTAAPRGMEIAEFIRNWNDDHPKDEIDSFVIFDDDDDMDYIMPFLIQTPFKKGLTNKDADKAIEMLGEKDK